MVVHWWGSVCLNCSLRFVTWIFARSYRYQYRRRALRYSGSRLLCDRSEVMAARKFYVTVSACVGVALFFKPRGAACLLVDYRRHEN